jgi:DNA-binding XRE family transcriptional regulator
VIITDGSNFDPCSLGWLSPYPHPFHPKVVSALPRHSNFARHLRDARIRRGLSSAEVADLVGVSPASVYFWETDLTALCRVLKLPIRATREMAG